MIRVAESHIFCKSAQESSWYIYKLVLVLKVFRAIFELKSLCFKNVNIHV